MYDFSDQTALVTGAGSGIGRSTALEFARCGAAVAVADIDLEAAEETVALIRGGGGGDVVALQVDVSQSSQVEKMVTDTVDAFGRLDFAFNNAGITGEAGTVVGCTEENWDRVMEVNLKGVWLCLKYELIRMLERGKGSIVNMSSVAGLVGIHDEIAPYSPAKHGVIGLTRTAALETATQGVRINAICPGEIQTPMQETYLKDSPELAAKALDAEPIGRLGEPEEIAAAVLWLCSDAASFVTGHAMAVDGGYLAQ